MLLSSEEIIDSIHREMGKKRRSENLTLHVLSKNEMKDILVYIVTLKNSNKELHEFKTERESIVQEVVGKLTSKDGEIHE